MRNVSSDDLPISEALFARLMRSEPDDVRAFAARLPEHKRAQLASFCYARAHLRQVGLLIARECSRFSLECERGQAGVVLFDRAKAEFPGADLSEAPQRRPISLSNVGLR